MGRTVKSETIVDPKILKAIKECCDVMTKLGITIPEHVKYKTKKTTAWYGLADYSENSITLSAYILNDPEDELKRTIYHELAHLAANAKDPGCGHRGLWKDYVATINRATGMNITRVTPSSMGMHKEFVEFKAKKLKSGVHYTFECPRCGQSHTYKKITRFVRQYSDTMWDGSPRWYCGRCYREHGVKQMFRKVDD